MGTWKLLTLVKQDRILSRGALVWVDAIVWAIAAGWTMLAVLAAVVVLNADAEDERGGVRRTRGPHARPCGGPENGRAKAVRFSTLEAMYRVLGCQPGDLLEFVADGD